MRSFAEVIERVGDQGLQILLYHIPQVSGVAISPGLIERLRKRYPRIVVGMKDSSGDMTYTKAAILRFPGFKVYCRQRCPSARHIEARWRGLHFGDGQCQSCGHRQASRRLAEG